MSILKKNMKINKTKIPGLYIFEPKVYNDKRGFFFESFLEKELKKVKKGFEFPQENLSFSKKNILRGIHFQWKKPQAQIMHLITGKIFIVFVDFRLNSKTFLKKEEFIINHKDHHQIIMPAGVGSGHYTLAKKNIIHYKVSEYYNPSNEMGIKWNCKKLNIKWPQGKKILSSKDRLNPYTLDVDFKKFKDLRKIK